MQTAIDTGACACCCMVSPRVLLGRGRPRAAWLFGRTSPTVAASIVIPKFRGGCRFPETSRRQTPTQTTEPMALSLISSATTSFAGAAALPNPIRTIAEPIAAIGIVGFDQ